MSETTKETKYDTTQETVCQSCFTFWFLNSPRLHSFGRAAGSQVIFCHNPKIVVAARDHFGECEPVGVDQVTHHVPQALLRFTF